MVLGKRKSSRMAYRAKRAKSSGFRKRKPSYRRTYKKGGSKFAKAVKAVILKTAEKKYHNAEPVFNSSYDIAFGGYPLNHNSMVRAYLSDNTGLGTPANHVTAIAQGNTDSLRNGDEIYAKGIMLRGTITIPADRKNTRFRMYWVEHNSNNGNLTVFNDVFHNITGSVHLDPVQTDRWSLKLLGEYRFSDADTSSTILEGQRGTIMIKKWIPFNRKLRYLSDTTMVVTKGMKEQISLLFTTYDNTSAATLSTCGYVRMAATLHFGDP
jgi:hypothetical protein